MSWLEHLLTHPESVEGSILVYAVTIAVGLALGAIKYRKIGLGVAGVLFSGLAMGHFGFEPNLEVVGFLREFGLVLFVFAVGLSVGPGFFEALRTRGLRLNLLAAAIVGMGVAMTLGLMIFAKMSGPLAIGLCCGAVTNTPSLAAAEQALRDNPPGNARMQEALREAAPNDELATKQSLSDEEAIALNNEVYKLPAITYALCYPGGVFGIIMSIVLLRWILGVNPEQEAHELEVLRRQQQPDLERRYIRITNPNLHGMPIGRVPALEQLHCVISRVLRRGKELPALPDLLLVEDDIVLVVGKLEHIEQLQTIVGEWAEAPESAGSSPLEFRWIVVSRRRWAGRKVEELGVMTRHEVQVTRIRRAGIELPPLSDTTLSLGDEIAVVGLPENIKPFAAELGNSFQQLGHPELVSMFVGIALGIVVGSIPIALPYVPTSIKLGMAGGPLLVAMLLSRVQRVGSITWYLPSSASMLLKELGIAIFLASVGLKSGDRFVETFARSESMWWLLAGASITMIPMLTVGIIAYQFVRERYLTIVGMLAGSMTDPPALAFAQAMSKSDIPSVSYATVYPLTMILRVVSAQCLMMYWAS